MMSSMKPSKILFIFAASGEPAAGRGGGLGAGEPACGKRNGGSAAEQHETTIEHENPSNDGERLKEGAGAPQD